MVLRTGDTITAISTPKGVGGISIVRISGKDAFEIGDKIFRGKKKLKDAKNNTIHHGYLIDTKTGNEIDEVLCMVMRAPYTYTRENILEINTHGGTYLAKRILRIVLDNGARLAKKGEFTLRAFINGRIDLVQAEAIKEIIESESDVGIDIAAAQLKGELSRKIEKIREELIDIYSIFEVQIDFSDEDIGEIDKKDIEKRIKRVKKKIKKLKESYNKKREKLEKPNIVITGRINTGKSTLLNRLIKEDKAIVDETPGTTRDVVETEIIFSGRRCRIADTAGIRETKEKIETKGIKKTEEEIKNADLILYVEDITLDNDVLKFRDEEFLKKNKKKAIKIKNKIDLVEPEKIKEKGERNGDIVFISAKKGKGIKELVRTIEERVVDESEIKDRIFIMNERQADLIEKSYNEIKNLQKGLKNDISIEYLTIHIREALNYIDEITGKKISEEVLDNIFENFCIGK